MDIINIISGPVIGSVIGYFTNYIAVKMLFRPLNPVKIGSITLPFTPGIIPKRKNELGKAIGNAVGNNLLTTEDLEKSFMSDDIKNTVVDKIVSSVFDSDSSVNDLALKIAEADSYSAFNSYIENSICEKIISALDKINLGNTITEIGAAAIKEKVQGSMLALMVNDSLIASFTEPMAVKINNYITENGTDIVRPFIFEEIHNLENKQIPELFSSVNINKENIKNALSKIYDSIVADHLSDVISKFNIAKTVEEKINNMDVLEIEKLVLSVMKNELDAIVNLGAVIGFIIGIINIFI